MKTQVVGGDTNVSLSNLPHGVYLVTFTGHEIFRSLKFVY